VAKNSAGDLKRREGRVLMKEARRAPSPSFSQPLMQRTHGKTRAPGGGWGSQEVNTPRPKLGGNKTERSEAHTNAEKNGLRRRPAVESESNPEEANRSQIIYYAKGKYRGTWIRGSS